MVHGPRGTIYFDSGNSMVEILTETGAGDISSYQFEPVYTAKQILHRKEARERVKLMVDNMYAGSVPVGSAPCGAFWDLSSKEIVASRDAPIPIPVSGIGPILH